MYLFFDLQAGHVSSQVARRSMQPRDGGLRLRGWRVRGQQAAGEGEQRRHRRGHRRLLGHHRRRPRARTPVSCYHYAN